MSTRAMYTFEDEDSTVHVYKHHDGYPEGGISHILNALEKGWPLPRFDVSDFAAAFVAANKNDGGGGVLMCGTDIKYAWEFSADSEYHYTITCPKGELHVRIDEVNWEEYNKRATEIFKGTLDEAVGQYIG